MSNILDKLRNKKKVMSRTSWQGTDDYHDWYKKAFNYKHGKGASEVPGLDYAKDYKYNPNILEKFLDKVPGVGGYRDYQRVANYQDRVFYNPNESRESEKMMERSVKVAGKTMSDFQSIDNKAIDNRFSGGSTSVASEDPRNFTANMFSAEDDRKYRDTFIQGTKSGHIVSDRPKVGAIRGRSIDPYNIATSKLGNKFLGIFPMNYQGKITSNVAEGGGSKLDPFINSDTLAEQVMQNKNLAVANSAFYNNKRHWDTKKDFNKKVEISNKRWSNSE